MLLLTNSRSCLLIELHPASEKPVANLWSTEILTRKQNIWLNRSTAAFSVAKITKTILSKW
jgi:hypothetical protein